MSRIQQSIPEFALDLLLNNPALEAILDRATEAELGRKEKVEEDDEEWFETRTKITDELLQSMRKLNMEDCE